MRHTRVAALASLLSVAAEEPKGKGRLVLFGFRPQYRAQSELTYKFFFNALLDGSSTPVERATELSSGQ